MRAASARLEPGSIVLGQAAWYASWAYCVGCGFFCEHLPKESKNWASASALIAPDPRAGVNVNFVEEAEELKSGCRRRDIENKGF